MEPVDLRAILARTPGPMARHPIAAAATAGGASTDLPDADLIPLLLTQPLAARASGWLATPDPQLIDTDRRAMAADRLQVVCALDPEYPRHLLPTPGAPAALGRPALAIAGAIQATPAGDETARSFSADLTRAGVGFIAGLAEGIETKVQDGPTGAGGGAVAVCALHTVAAAW